MTSIVCRKIRKFFSRWRELRVIEDMSHLNEITAERLKMSMHHLVQNVPTSTATRTSQRTQHSPDIELTSGKPTEKRNTEKAENTKKVKGRKKNEKNFFHMVKGERLPTFFTHATCNYLCSYVHAILWQRENWCVGKTLKQRWSKMYVKGQVWTKLTFVAW